MIKIALEKTTDTHTVPLVFNFNIALFLLIILGNLNFG